MNDLAKQLGKHFLSDDPEIDFRIKQGIATNRMGFGKLELAYPDGTPVDAASVTVQLKRREYHFGCNLFMLGQFPDAESNSAYEETFRKVFNLAVLPLYWSDLEPEDGALRFTKDSPCIYRRPSPDACLEYCERYGITPKGHPLLWHQFWPEWLNGSKGDISARIARRFTEIAERYADRIRIWDVCNEAQSVGGRGKLPDSHVDLAFELAGRLFPGATLTYNDDSHWWNLQGDYSPVYLLVRHLQEHYLKVNALGCQYHMFEGSWANVDTFLNPRHILKCMDQYAKLGVPMNLSEISITSKRVLGDDADEFQARVLERLYSLWFSHAATNGIIWWNLVDGTAAYAPLGSDEGENSMRAGLVNFDFTPKKAFTVLERLLTREWSTNTKVAYEAGAPNSFHGFYGDYDAQIETSRGVTNASFALRAGQPNTVTLTVA